MFGRTLSPMNLKNLICGMTLSCSSTTTTTTTTTTRTTCLKRSSVGVSGISGPTGRKEGRQQQQQQQQQQQRQQPWLTHIRKRVYILWATPITPTRFQFQWSQNKYFSRRMGFKINIAFVNCLSWVNFQTFKLFLEVEKSK